MAVLTGLLCFCLLVYFSILTTALYSLPETSVIKPPQKLKMNSQNFQHILSWEAGSNTTGPTYYRVMYIDLRLKEDWKIAKECSNTTHLFCNLTEEYENYPDKYLAIVQSFTEHGVFNSSLYEFSPYFSTYLGPPAVDLTACLNCINVTVKLPAVYLKERRSLIGIYGKLDYTIMLESFDTEKKIPIKNETSKESFSYVVSSLHSNTNYCVSVAVAASLNHNSIPSALNCIITRSTTQPDYAIISILNGGLVSFGIVIVLIGLYKGGFICLKSKPWPKVLETTNKIHCPVHELDPEKVCSVQLIYKEIKKRERKYSYDDDSESDSENSGIYTRHGILGTVTKSYAKSNTFVQQSIDCTSTESSSQANELLASDVENSEEHQSVIRENESTSRVFFQPLSEVNSSSTSGLSDSACFNINLNTVMLGDPDKTWDDSATLISHQEDAVDLQDFSASDALESKIFTNTVDVKKPDCHNISHEWQKPSVSDESDISDSEYIRR